MPQTRGIRVGVALSELRYELLAETFQSLISRADDLRPRPSTTTSSIACSASNGTTSSGRT